MTEGMRVSEKGEDVGVWERTSGLKERGLKERGAVNEWTQVEPVNK